LRKPPNELTATAALEALLAGRLTAEALARACLDRVATREPQVHAFAFVDPGRALDEARARDRASAKGPLHGLPFGVKDLIDTQDMPTECGSPIYKGHRPPSDASCVALARHAGAVMLGKTVTTEFAMRHPGPTANPANVGHTPGGSSSGSAAAVADFMVPLAFGTQTGGSVIRPASYCGAVGYKPTHGTINPTGVKPLANSFDTVGLFARAVEDCALAVAVLADDVPERRRLAAAKPARVGLLRGADWGKAEPDMQLAVEATAARLARDGVVVEEAALPAAMDGFGETQSQVLRYEAYRVFADERLCHDDQLSAEMRGELAIAATISRAAHVAALAAMAEGRQAFAALMRRFDLVLTPAAPGEAPKGLGNTGEATFNRLQSGLGVPCVSLPGFVGPNGLPLGVQVTGAFGDDYRVLGWAKWIGERIGEGQ